MLGIYEITENFKSKDIWIDTNDINDTASALSEIKLTEKECIVPIHIYNDSLVEDDILSDCVDIKITEAIYPRNMFSHIQNVRKCSYRACIWYEEIKDVIPTAESIILEPKSLEHLRILIKENIKSYPFVRLCNMSPKDIKEIPLYEDYEEAFNDIISSKRTKNIFDEPYCFDCCSKHLFMRKKRNFVWEVRCFWSKDRLTAVSLPPYVDFDDHQDVYDFFTKYKKYIPYHSAIIDIGKNDNGVVELVEINSFGPDMNATSGNFGWYEDIVDLLSSKTTIFR